MSRTNINRVVFSGNLTADPELRALPSGRSVCTLRVANNRPRKDSATDEWVEKANYINVSVFGPRAESAARYLSKGSRVLIDGRFDWREWDAQDGSKRQAIEVIGEEVEFMDSKERSTETAARPEQVAEVPSEQADELASAAVGEGGDDIPS